MSFDGIPERGEGPAGTGFPFSVHKGLWSEAVHHLELFGPLHFSDRISYDLAVTDSVSA